ncbi:MAG: hypothetical protein F6K00_04315 [Leptolyngbya sp. SIOISBB]|nr:hypothetical protein [Leptolyngbya sp. SIOISBB]
MASVKTQIRNLLPSVDTRGVPPHQKTPSGKTQILHLNYTLGQTDQSMATEMAYIHFLAQTGKALGLRLVILTHPTNHPELERELAQDADDRLEYTLLHSQHPVSKWAEDSVEYLANGDVAVLIPFDEPLLARAMTDGRQQRWAGMIAPEHLAAALQDDDLWVPLGVRVNTLKTGAERELLAQTAGQHVGHIRAYIEGGNLIAGEDAAGQPIILVGKDAISATAHIYQLSDDEVRQLISEDFGLDIDQIISVEQPGKFHLDMGLLFIGHGVVIVNHSQAALQDAIEMAEMVPCLTTETMAAKLQLQVALEEVAANDLTVAGLEVRREKLENDVQYNFFNGEFVEGQDGCTYYLTNGGPQEQMAKFQALMVQDWQVVKNVIFSPPAIAQKSLQERGGLGCRLKGAVG